MHSHWAASVFISISKNEMKLNKTKDSDWRQVLSVIYPVVERHSPNQASSESNPETNLRLLFLLALLSCDLFSQEWKVEPTWLHRYVPTLSQGGDLSAMTCRHKSIFGEGDSENRAMISVARFEEVTLDAHGDCPSSLHDHEEEIYFVLEGNVDLNYAGKTYAMRANDFTYLPPGVKHAIANASGSVARILVMGFKIPFSISMEPASQPKIVNLDDVKEETVEGHPTSVLYKLLVGPRTGKRDAIDEAYVETS
jgi:mannose-6-phosphate isomerase-like protein (cupin superfamily)